MNKIIPPPRKRLPLVFPRFALTALLAASAALGPRCQAENTFYKEMGEGMMQMDASMAAADKARSGNVDADFIRMMIPHHQGAVDMAKAVILHGTDPALKNIAQEIVADQTIEIQYMQKIQARLEPAKKISPVAAPNPSTGLKQTGNDFRTVANDEPSVKPAAHPGVEDYSRDRVYTADQVSNTVSVIDPATNQLLGLIKLGELPPAAIQPLYKGQSLVHGLGFSPDGSRICVISIGSNSITLIDTSTNKVLKSHYLGRSPHEAFFTPDGKEIYAAVRGEDYVSVLNAETLDEITRIKTNSGPGMILFRPDGKYAFVPSSFTPELCVIDCATHEVVARVPQVSPFSPNLAVSADGKQVWFTLKDSGKTQVMSTEPPFAILGTLASGPITNHVTTVDNAKGHFAYVSVGGLDTVKVYRREPPFEQVATIPTGALPHGIWSSPDGSRVYVGLENEAKVQAIDTATNKIVATIPIGQLPQALVYVPNAAAHAEDGGKSNLVPLASLKESRKYELRATDEKNAGRASVTVISLGLIDQIQVAASGLVPGAEYTFYFGDASGKPSTRLPLTRVKANAFGSAIADTLGPLPGSASPAVEPENGDTHAKFLLEADHAETAPTLIQR